MDYIDIIAHEPDLEEQDEGSDIDGEQFMDDLDNENIANNADLDDDNDQVPQVNVGGAGAPPGPHAGRAAQPWNERLTPIQNTPFTGKIHLFIHFYIVHWSYSLF